MPYLGTRQRRGGESFTPEPTCCECGKRGAHFVPPSLGEEGFFICKPSAPREPALGSATAPEFLLRLPTSNQNPQG